MKKIAILLLSYFVTYLQAQQITVALHHNGTATMFYGNNAFSNANNTAVNGDTIYLPGNSYYSGVTVTAQLVIIGAGIHPDSTTATGYTNITSDISFQAGSDGSVLEGIYTGNNIYIGSNTRVNNVTVRRCYFSSLYFQSSFDTTHTCKNEIIEQNVINGGLLCNNSDYLIIRNNFIQGQISGISQNALIENNIFYYQPISHYGAYTIYNISGSVIRNNIFILPATGPYQSNNYYITGGSNNNVMNNIFPVTSVEYSGDIYTNNYEGIGTDTIFVNDTVQYSSYAFNQNYHLIHPLAYPGYFNEGVGVYGGTVPMKDGLLPTNPHIIQQTIAPNTDTNGKLNINIKVDAQNN
jgi:hypothetical protein